MCGLAGYVGLGDAAYLKAACRLLVHRGPDASGIWHGKNAGLAHRRLSILDLSETGAQPMSRDRVHLAFNGEIYNCRELRRDLESDGYVFRGYGDTEVILNGYLAWGDAVVDRLSGMFAFAIWDEHEQHLLLARDRIGIKPLFYARHKDGIVFASEIKAILGHSHINKRLNRSAVDSYLALGYMPAPETIYSGVRALRPGEKLVWQDGDVKSSNFADVTKLDYVAMPEDEEQLIEELDGHLNRAVKAHLLADVEVGAFLSGGMDSSLVAAIAARHSDSTLKTFTIGFSGSGDERSFARMVAGYIDSDHREALAEMGLTGRLPQLLRNLEQPLFDNSILSTWLVSREARAEVKVVLSGDGGDEPFFGYDWTRWALSLPQILPSTGVYGWEWAYQSGKAGRAKRLLHDLSHSAEVRYLRRITTDRAFRHWLYTADYLDEVAGNTPLAGIEVTLASRPSPDRFVLADLKHYLPEDVLFKVDRMSMAHGLEVRVPLLDHKLLEWELALPVKMRFRHGRGKYLLRRVAERYLPDEILKPRKQGFTIPIGAWLRGSTGDEVRRLFSSPGFAERGIIRPERALQLLDMHKSGRFELGHRIWSLVVLEQWFRVWMDEDGGCNVRDA